MKIAITWPMQQEILDKLKQFEVAVNPKEEPLTPDELKKMIVGADAILCMLNNKITADVIESAGPQLKIIATMSVGYDHIDLEAAKAKNIIVTNTPHVSNISVAEHAVALLLSLAKQVPQADSFVRSGKYKGWDPTLFVGPELSGKIIGIVGLGEIGKSVARIAGFGLGMAIAYNDVAPSPAFEAQYNATYFDLDTLLTIADVVSLHVPLMPQTTHLINFERLAKMKPTAYLINTARGPVIDEAALVKALLEEKIAGAALDVYENEPNISPALLEAQNVILTPHTASATYEARMAMAQKAVDNILAVLSGQPAMDSML
jgi:glyoxylate reductase